MNVAVTGVHAGCQRAPGLAVAISLQQSKRISDVVLVDYDNRATGLYWPGQRGRYLMDWTETPEHLFEQLLRIHREVTLDAVIPSLNPQIKWFSQIRELLTGRGIATLLPSFRSVLRRRKDKLSELCEQIGVHEPATICCRDKDQLERASKKLGYPCVVKGYECGAFAVREPALLDYYVEYCSNTFGFPVLLQEWIEGREYSLHGLCDDSSNIMTIVAVKKLGLTDQGHTWMSVSVKAPEMKQLAGRFAKVTGWKGPFELDLMRQDDGTTLLLDVNPRFPDWVDGLTSCGINTPEAAVLLAVEGERVSLPEIKPGTVFCKDFTDYCFSVSGLLLEALPEENDDERKTPRPLYRRV